MSANKEFKALSRRERIAVAYVCTVLGIGSTFILTQQEVVVLFLAVQGLHGAEGKAEEGAGSCWGPLIQNRAGACGWAQRQCVGIAIPGNTCVQGSDDWPQRRLGDPLRKKILATMWIRASIYSLSTIWWEVCQYLLNPDKTLIRVIIFLIFPSSRDWNSGLYLQSSQSACAIVMKASHILEVIKKKKSTESGTLYRMWIQRSRRYRLCLWEI